MTISEKLMQLRAYALTAKVSIYNEDAMTAIELAGQTACKVNECIDAINNLLDIVDELANIVGLQWDEATETLIV